jgi:ribonuclease-3
LDRRSDLVSGDGDGELCEALACSMGYRFRDPSLLALALSHPSHAYEVDGSRGNERLEYLGDAVLDLVIAECCYHAHPDWNEGDLTRARAALVNQRSLAQQALAAGLDGLVLLGRTELSTGGERKDSVLANCLEAVLGAMYLDGGLEPVEDWVRKTWGDEIESATAPQMRDVKTSFQEWAHAELQVTPRYRTVSDSGQENDSARFTVEAVIGDEVWGTGSGRSKRAAERAAAAAAVARRDDADD